MRSMKEPEVREWDFWRRVRPPRPPSMTLKPDG
jgi:hypothetical protein